MDTLASPQGLAEIARHVKKYFLLKEHKGSECVGLADNARHVIVCHLTSEVRIQNMHR